MAEAEGGASEQDDVSFLRTVSDVCFYTFNKAPNT